MTKFVASDTFTVDPFEEFLDLKSQLYEELAIAAPNYQAELTKFDVDPHQQTLTLEWVIDGKDWVEAESLKKNIYRLVFGIDDSGQGNRGRGAHTAPFTVDREQLMLA